MSEAPRDSIARAELIISLKAMANAWNADMGPAFELTEETEVLFEEAFGKGSPVSKRMEAIEILRGLGLIVDKKEVKKVKHGPTKLVGGVREISQGRPPDRPLGVSRLRDFGIIKVETAKWFWKGRLLYGALNLIEGDPGVGKSTFLGWLMSIVSRGGQWPDNGHVDQGDVVIIQQEEDCSGDIAPRLRAMKADVTKIHNFEGVTRGDKTSDSLKLLGDFDAIESIVEQVPNLRLLVLDPVSLCFRGSEIRNTSDVRDGLTPLLRLAQQKSIAVVGIIHFNKSQDLPLIYRAADSAAFVQVARSVLLVSPDPRDEDRRLLSFVKGNHPERIMSALAFSFDGKTVKWDRKPVKLRGEAIDSALQKLRLKSGDEVVAKKFGIQSANADRYILALLANGERSQEGVCRKADDQGYPESNLRRALKRLTSEHDGDPRVTRFAKEVAGVKKFWLRLTPPRTGTEIHLYHTVVGWNLPLVRPQIRNETARPPA